jgi:hypothetical protein
VADLIRVVFQWHLGLPWRQASEEEREQSNTLLLQIFEKWKRDPGITHRYYFLRRGVAHYNIFEVDDLSKIDEMDNDITLAQGLLLEKYSFEVVFANRTVADAWGS